MAAPALTKVFPLTLNGRSPADEITGGAAPPRVPVKVWTLAVSMLVMISKIRST
jgi:hypothetical protein